MCDKCNSTEICTCSKQINTDDIFYESKECNAALNLTNLNLPVGTSLSTILRKIDYKLGDNLNTVNFNGFNLAYLRTKYSINNIKTFSESSNLEFQDINGRINTINSSITAINSSYTSLNSEVSNIKYPNILDNANVGFTVNDTINTVLQKIVTKFNTISNTPVNSPSIIANSSSSIAFSLSGSLNHTISANVRISNYLNNRIQLLQDGLYVAPTSNTSNQTLSIIGNQLSISNGNTVSIPVQGLQQLSLAGNQLSISGGNTISMPSVTETALIANPSNSVQFTQTGTSGHTILANVKVSTDVGNKLVVQSNGLYVGNNTAEILSEINTNSTLKTTFCNLVSSCNNVICYKWNVSNTGSSSVSFSYTDTNDVIQTISISNGSFATVSGTKINTNPTSTLIITFLGKC